LKFLLVLLLLVVLFCRGAALDLVTASRNRTRFCGGGRFVDVPRGASSRHAASLLKTNGVVRSALALRFIEAASEGTLQAGEYFSIMP